MHASVNLPKKCPRSNAAKVRVVVVLALVIGTAVMIKLSRAQNAPTVSQQSFLAKPAKTPEERAVQRALLREMILNPQNYQVKPSTPAELASIQAIVDAVGDSKRKTGPRTPEEAAAAAAILNPQRPQQPQTPAEADAIEAITNPEAYAKAKGIAVGPPRFSFEQDSTELTAAAAKRDPLVKPGPLDRSKLRPSVPRKP